MSNWVGTLVALALLTHAAATFAIGFFGVGRYEEISSGHRLDTTTGVVARIDTATGQWRTIAR